MVKTFYKSFLNLKLIEIESLKIFIKTHLVNSFMRLLKFIANVSSYLLKSQIKSFIFLLIIKILTI